ncbi:MAG: amino acid permease [Rhizobiales bacterium]|nr:amino acid permease [Hyphomicrobiales bacterium]
MSELSKSLNTWRGAALMLNIVIGAGLLALPGLAVQNAGHLAVYSWLVCAIVSLPLIGIFVLLGRRYPNAGGIAHFTGIAFGRPGYAAASLVFLGAVLFGLPSIALTGGHYLSVLTGASPHLMALLLLVLATLGLLVPSALSAQINTYLAFAILCTILFVLISGWVLIGDATTGTGGGVGLSPPDSLSDVAIIFAPFMIIFFAFTGWEVAAGLSEEFSNPKRDFPLAMIISFVVILLIYIGIAVLAQKVPLEGYYETAFARIASVALGLSAERLVSILAAVIVLANLSGAIWAVSRLVFSLSREGYLPKQVQASKSGTPWVAVLITASALYLIVILDWFGFFGLGKMLALAGQNFIILYGAAAISLFVLTNSLAERLLALVATLLVTALVILQGVNPAYPSALIIIGLLIGWASERRMKVNLGRTINQRPEFEA